MHPSEIPRFVIAVDFGAISTSVAYAHSGDSENLEFVRQWPGCGNRSSDQVPTEISFGTRSGAVCTSADGRRQYKWGFGVGPKGWRIAEPFILFKLLLDDRNPRVANNTFAAQTAARMKKFRLSTIDVSADYLSAVREHTITVLERRYRPEFIRKTKFEYVLTVPAAWSALAMTSMIEVARNAGFGEYETDFNLIAETEAAAAYTLEAIQPNILNEEDIFVVCSAEKKWVDVVSYRIQQLHPLVINVIGDGSGGFFGSDYIDEQFQKHVRDLFGDDTVDRMRPIPKREMMRTWKDNVKFKFVDAEEMEYYEVYIPGVPDNEEKGVEQGFLSLSRAAVKNIFDQVIDSIIELIDEKIRNVKGRDVSAILLVGEFGASEYLYKRLREQIFSGGKVQVMQPKNAWSANTRGALIQGLNGALSKDYMVRRHYEANICGG